MLISERKKYKIIFNDKMHNNFPFSLIYDSKEDALHAVQVFFPLKAKIRRIDDNNEIEISEELEEE